MAGPGNRAEVPVGARGPFMAKGGCGLSQRPVCVLETGRERASLSGRLDKTRTDRMLEIRSRNP